MGGISYYFISPGIILESGDDFEGDCFQWKSQNQW